MRAATAALLALALAGCASPGDDRDYFPVTHFTDIHGLAVDPEDPDELYVATHEGLIRGKDGAWARVGRMQDDLMGFSMHPEDGDTFWTSGHPRGGGNMGVRWSTDGGFTWEQLSLEGVDFHALTVSPADASTLWGSWRGSIYHSVDGGRTWETYPNAPPARSLAAHPRENATLYATTAAGIQKSTDAGRTWSTLASVAAASLVIDRADPTLMFASLATGVSRSADGGLTWSPLPLRTSAPVGHLALDPHDPSRIFAATYATAIHHSADGGATWTQVRAAS